jgi:hypothetical protein
MDRTTRRGSRERRRTPRVSINSEFGRVWGLTWVSNLSETGAFVRGCRFFRIGTEIDLRFTVLVDDPVIVEAEARVLYHCQRRSGVGVEFTGVRPAMADLILDLLPVLEPIECPHPY